MSSIAGRDWLSTLWPASFKGVPFFFEQDKETGGRGLVIHEFPNRDDPFIEDLGEAPRFFSGSAYVHGDNVDALANALKTALASRGAGTLVTPYFGPVTVHCQEFERSNEREKLGYIAFEIKLVRAGALTALISVPFLQNAGFLAAGNVAVLLGSLFPQSVMTAGQPDYVVAGVTDTLAGAASAVDVLRQSYPVDPTASATIRDQVATFIADTVPAIDGEASAPLASAAASLVDMVRQVVAAMPPASAIRASLDLAGAYSATASGVPYVSDTTRRAAQNVEATARLVRLAALTAYAEATMRRTFADRPAGITARGEVAERFEAELYDTTGAALAPLYVAIESLRGAVIEWLTGTINNLAPVITVESAVIRPSLDLAWVLYADPTRAVELVARNQVRHPSFMPRKIEALAR